MFRRLALACLPAFALIGCFGESEPGNPSGPAQSPQDVNTVEIRSLEKLVDIEVGAKSVTMYKGPDGSHLVESVYPKGEQSLLSAEMVGMNWKEIHELLAPGQPVRAGLEEIVFDGQGQMETPTASVLSEGSVNSAGDMEGAVGLQKTAADAAWFQNNYCGTGSAFSWCLLNRANFDDWGWSNCKTSTVYIVLNWGVQVNLKIKIGSTNTLQTTILNDGYVHSWYSKSGKNWLGLYKNETHRYDITGTSGSGWHWSVIAHTW